MSSKDKEASPADGETGASDTPKKPARTIDLEAEEVKVEDEASSQDASKEDAETSGDEAATDDGAEAKDEAGGKSPPPPQRTRPSDVKSFVTHLAAGLVGGLIGVVGAGIGLGKLPFTGLTGGGSPSATTVQIEERLDEIATAVSEQRKTIAGLPGDASIDEVKKRIAAIEARPAPEAGVPPEMAERLASLEKTFKTLEQAGGGDGASNVEQAAALVARVDGVETDLEKRYAALEDQIAQTKSAISQAAPSNSDPEAAKAAKAAVDAVNKRIEALEKKLDDAIASAPAGTPVAPDGKAAGVALAFQALRRAAESGAAFSPQLESLDSLAGDSADVSALASFAARGVPTQTDLFNELPGVVKSARLAVSRSGDDTLLERLASNAQSVVRIRRIGPVEGSDPGAVLSRMEAHAGKGDLQAVLKEAGQLEGAAAESVAPWLEQARARVALDAALVKLETRLLANLGAARADRE